MKAMILTTPGKPLELRDIAVPKPSVEQILIKIHACGVCRTDLHIYDGELSEPKLPLVMGHEIVGEVSELGANVKNFKIGDRVGVPWLGWTCGECKYCKSGRENLCDNAKFTGYTLDGGYAEYTVACQRYCFKIPRSYNEYEASPLLCAGLIGYRSYKMCGSNIKRLGIYGFGAAAHIISQIAVHNGIEVYAFTRKGDTESQNFAKKLGAVWTGSSEEFPSVKLDASIIFAPVGSLIPIALKSTEKGGVVVCGGIHMSNIPEFSYKLLWEERRIKSVANLTRQDGEELLEVSPRVPVKTEIQLYSLEDANKALNDLRNGKVKGAAVLKII
ncbi:MAG: zinc-dependent alcohol dehydrogenase family protein [Chlorobi bacterium]|nr:zinc-dependent alcohol dehydrogenase family protein [Chlorobiota bacterium]MCI0715627.1 zinc-dependent alcohol dehydrogenase family protein [Chlorobiota bacterium]